MIDEKKQFLIKKGRDDFDVWNKPSDYLCDLICAKRNSTFKSIKLRRDVKVIVIIKEIPKNG